MNNDDVLWTTLDSSAFEAGIEYGEEPEWWPDGASEQLIREAATSGCSHSRELVEALDAERAELASDGEHAALSSYTEEVSVADE